MKTTAEENKRLVLEAFDALFNRRDYAAAARFWSPDYIQHSAHIEPGREGLFNLVKTLPSTLTYEAGTIVADEDFVIDHGRFSGFLPVNWIAADILRIEDGVLVKHWDVIQDEATEELSAVGRAQNPWRAPETRDRRRRAHRLQADLEAAASTLADVANIPRQPRPRSRLDRFLHGANR